MDFFEKQNIIRQLFELFILTEDKQISKKKKKTNLTC